ncbi:DegV family protein [Lactococcus sp. dk322]|uniref:DegV family protein n=1 Tax=Lactococcus sp. dk322 TaxID=2603290 RepID=UPI0011C8F216|nr:DegV family protein [Lactococcus sp. dk322]TXK46356.1 DegV family EDD domain-containing protein [Lactococcus sp. dk322]
MEVFTLNSIRLLNSIKKGAQLVIDKKEELNSINIFPVADADTGSNLASLMESLLDVSISPDSTSKDILFGISDVAVLGSRGNSGLIFSQFLSGLAVNFKVTEDNESDFVNAATMAVKNARESLMEPKDGTIISAMEVWESNLKQAFSMHSFEDSLLIAEETCKVEVKNTKFKNKVLKKSKVVDSGALGFYYFISGFTSSYVKKENDSSIYEGSAEFIVNNDDEFFLTDRPQKRYCSEFIVSHSKISIDILKEKLSSFGDSIVVANMSMERIKVHIHTDNPSLVLELLRYLGEIRYQKVDDMLLQYMISNHDDSEIAVVTDSVADLPDELLLNSKISVLPMNITLGEENFLDKITTKSDYFYNKVGMISGKTSQPSIPAVDALFSYLEGKYKHVIVITVSSQLSGTYQMIRQRIKEKKYDDSWIQVVDSKLNSVAQGLIVEKAVQLISEGNKFKDIINELESSIERTFIYVYINDLSYMINSGRIPQKLGKWVKNLSLFPVVSLNRKGRGILKGVYLTRTMSLNSIMKRINKMISKDKIESLGIAYTTESDEVTNVLKQIKTEQLSYYATSSASILINAGKGIIAIAGIQRRK